MRRSLFCFLLSWCLIAVNAQPSNAQISPPDNQEKKTNKNRSINLSPAAEKTKKKINDIGLGNDATVVMLNTSEFYGSIRSIEEELFLFYDVDGKRLFEIKYEEVKKVKKGYGSVVLPSGKRTSLLKKFLVGTIFVVALFAFVIVLLSTDDS